MNRFKKFLSAVLALTLMLSVFTACGKKTESVVAEAVPAESTTAPVAETEAPAEQILSDGYYHVGDKIRDFTITTYDGKEISLYKVLEEKDMVLLNLWASWCGPCGMEFPAMQEAYSQYQDKIEIIAMSVEPADTDEILAAYAQEKAMTFPVARDTVDMSSQIHHSSIPTSVVVDRFGTICLIEEGAMPDSAIFTRLFDIYTAEDYTESVYLPNMLAEIPNIQPADPAELNEALNGESGSLVFTNSSNEFHWPMTVEQKDGRTVAAASNVESPMSTAVVEAQVDAKAGDVLVMEYKFMSDYYLSTMRMTVDGKDVKVSSMSQDWTTYAYRFEEAGNHQLSVSFVRNLNVYEGNDGLWIDSIRLVSGDEAAEALAKNPQYPVSEEIRFELVNENVEVAAIVLEETEDLALTVLVCSDPVLRFALELDETIAPETAFVEDFAGNAYPLTSFVTADGYLVEVPNEDPSAFTSSSVWLHGNGEQMAEITIFASLEYADRFAKYLGEQVGISLKAMPWNDSMVVAEEPVGDGTYTVTYVDQNGDPVPGVMCQVCDANTCQVFVSDANGVCQFTLPAGAYEIHTLKVPAGYEGDTTTVTQAPVGGGELSFILTKN